MTSGSGAPEGRTIESQHNPIIADGSYYSADPAPLVVGDTLFILAGTDEAPKGVNDFVMNAWQLLATPDPEGGEWTHYPSAIRPEDVFAWATPGRAYAAQIVAGPDGRVYLYAPVMQADAETDDGFGIGVAVAETPLGPWTDAHPDGPIVSQTVPAPNDVHNIDPTVLVDTEGRVFMYWGSFGVLRGVELDADMVTPIGEVVQTRTLTGFFEAPWLFERNGTYYMAYAGNDAGENSACTPAVYHACIAYGTARDPLGPWTYRGVILGPVSSTTSHPGIFSFKDDWYIAYHTADAEGGGHFRRSVAIDSLRWDDGQTPARILPVEPTGTPAAAPGPRSNVAPFAAASASNTPVPVQYWIKALNDEKVETSPLPPDMWGTWQGADRPAAPWILYQWDEPVTVDRVRIDFFADMPPGSGDGVALPSAIGLRYWNGEAMVPLDTRDALTAREKGSTEARFDPVTTTCLAARFTASTDGTTPAGVAVEEWEVLATAPTALGEADRGTTDPACRDAMNR